jgi:hypothetical protein
MRQLRRILATFAAAATTATYTEQELAADGTVKREVTGLTSFRMSPWAGINIAIPSGVAAGVVKLRYKVASAADGTFREMHDEDGVVIASPATVSIQTVKNKVICVDPDMFASALVQLLPVDVNGAAIAPGAVVFEISVKD